MRQCETDPGLVVSSSPQSGRAPGHCSPVWAHVKVSRGDITVSLTDGGAEICPTELAGILSQSS